MNQLHQLQSLFCKISFCCLLNIFSTTYAGAQFEVRPDIKWQVLHSAHFDVIHSTAQQDLALLYAEKLEKARAELLNYFSEAPPKISVVINDKTDVTNGYATRIPYSHIVAFPVLPGPEESLANTGDWAYEFLAHEYTHILNMEPAGGIMKPLRSIFGSIVSPNMLLPTWWKEGLAVEMETRLGHHGRLRSNFQDAAIRAMVLDDSFFNNDIATINEIIPSWPGGMRPYLFGSLMWSQLLADHGQKVIENLNQHHSRRIPYFVEEPARIHMQTNYTDAYNQALEETSTRALAQIKKLNDVPPTKFQFLKNDNKRLSAPAISPDGQYLAFTTEDDSNSHSIKIITKKDLQKSFLESLMDSTTIDSSLNSEDHLAGDVQRISWFPDSLRFVFDKIDEVNRYESFSDLYVFNLTVKKTEQLTHGLRAREPAVSPNGNQLVFVKLSAGKTELALLDPNTKNADPKIIFSAPIQERLSYPTFINANEIIFSWRKHLGQEHLYKISLNTGKTEKILKDYPDARFPILTKDGLLFNSNKNGVQNLYLANNHMTEARPVSHTLTGMYMADMDPSQKEILATAMTSNGFNIVSIDKKDWHATAKSLPHVNSLLGDRYTDSAPNKNNSYKLSATSAEFSEYSAAGYLWPQYWIPFVAGSTSQNGIVVQASTSGFDPLKKHSYSLIASWDSDINKASVAGSYLNQTTSLPFAISTTQRNSYLGDISNEYSDFTILGAVLPDTFKLSRYSNLQVGWQFTERSTSVRSLKRTGPMSIISYKDYSQAASKISPDSGMGGYFGVFDFIPQDNFLSHWQFWLGGEKYFHKYLPKNHAVMIRAKGIYTPEKISALYGASTDSMVFIPDNPLPEYIQRGYQRGQIYGRNLINVNLEYRFPIMNIYRGSGTDPIFMRRISGAIIADSTAADGVFIDPIQGIAESINSHRWFSSAGVEAKVETTLGYVFPINFVIGYYQAFNTYNGSESVISTSIQISGF